MQDNELAPAVTAERICGVEDLEIGEVRSFAVSSLGEERVALVRTAQDQFCAIADTCSHADFSLAEGEVDLDDCTIECWKHGALFSLETGEALTLPATRAVAVYSVSVNDRDVVLTTVAGDDDE